MDSICNYLQCLHYFYKVVGQQCIVIVTLTTGHFSYLKKKKRENFKCIAQPWPQICCIKQILLEFFVFRFLSPIPPSASPQSEQWSEAFCGSQILTPAGSFCTRQVTSHTCYTSLKYMTFTLQTPTSGIFIPW